MLYRGLAVSINAASAYYTVTMDLTSEELTIERSEATAAATDRAALDPLPYHLAIRDFLKAEETDVWNWFASNKVRDEQIDSVRFELLKTTYRVDRADGPELYAAAEETAAKLGLDVPITIYQAQNPQGMNASLALLPDDAHIIFHGPIAAKLTDAELRALLAHELSHLLLWRGWDGEFLIVDQVLSALTNDPHAQPPHLASARLFGLYNEIFCDRGALSAVRDPLVVVSMLVKVQTAVEKVSAESYLRQAEEIFSKAAAKTDQLTHPEAFIRARAVKLWADRDKEADRKIEEMIEGAPALDELDLLGQRKVTALTRRLVDVFLAPQSLQTDAVIAHARMFFDDYSPPNRLVDDERLASDIATDDDALRDYYCFVLLDLVTADRDLEELPLASALQLTERLGWKDRFVELAKRELRMRKTQLDTIDQKKQDIMAKAK